MKILILGAGQVGASVAESLVSEKNDVTVVDISMIGATGRIYMSGKTESVIKARDEITRVLEAVVGREQ